MLFDDFWHFLKVYEAACSVLQTPEDYARLTTPCWRKRRRRRDLCRDLPLARFLRRRRSGAWRDYLPRSPRPRRGPSASAASCCAASSPASAISGPKGPARGALRGRDGGRLPHRLRHRRRRERGPTADFAWAFDCAREAGLRLTAHAGEWGGPTRCAALDICGVERIGHGVRAIEDPALVDAAGRGRARCWRSAPARTSRWASTRTGAQHPVARLRERGVAVTHVHRRSALLPHHLTPNTSRWRAPSAGTEADFRAINRDAARAAFCDEATRAARLAQPDQRLETARMTDHLTIVATRWCSTS
jgi:adenosine deaminase